MTRDVTTLADIPRIQAAARGGAVALECEDRAVTFAELERRAAAVADMLAAKIVAPGARVAWLGRSHEDLLRDPVRRGQGPSLPRLDQ